MLRVVHGWLALLPLACALACTPASAPQTSPLAPSYAERQPHAAAVEPAVDDADAQAPDDAPHEDPAEPTTLTPENGWHGTVFGALVDPVARDWEIVVVDYETPVNHGLPARGDEQEIAVASLPAGHVWIPPGWAEGDTWTLLTRTGTLTRKVERIGAWVSPASGTLHTEVHVGRAAKRSDGPAIALAGDVAASAPKLAKLVRVPVTALGHGALARIATALAAAHDPEDRERLAARTLVAKDVRAFAGRFPGGRTHAIFVRLSVDESVVVHALLFAKDDGAIELVHLGHPDGGLRPFAIVDLDADGVDEVAFEAETNDDGWSLQLAYWHEGGAQLQMLTGTGL